MAKRKKAWEHVFDLIHIRRFPQLVSVPAITDEELCEVESNLQIQLPNSYREFMKRFGPGSLQDWAQLSPIQPRQGRGQSWTLVGRTKALRKLFLSRAGPESAWLSTLVFFGSNDDGDLFAWDPAVVTRNRPHECRFYFVRRLDKERRIAAGDSFGEFVEWVFDEQAKPYGDGWSFHPEYMRIKKAPLKRDVKKWLIRNEGTVEKLARSIRYDGKRNLFPVLADALEECGCVNVDVLNSCRSDSFDIEGDWVLEQLLGQE